MNVRPRLPAAVIALGLTSLFTDVGTELIFPLLPVFLASLGASKTFIGLVEGVADTVASGLKLAAGVFADRVPRKKPLVLLGYGLASLARPLTALAGAPSHVLAVRVADRIGKGIRTAPRDAMIAAAAEPGGAGRAFGFHAAMDHLGAMLGPLLATLLLWLGLSLRQVFAFAIVPGLLAMACLLFAREPVAAASIAPAPAVLGSKGAAPERLPRSLGSYLAILLLFSLGNSSDAFLLLRARELGVSVANIPLLWAAFSGIKMLAAYGGGGVADRLPRVWLIVSGWSIYAITYLGLGLADRELHAWLAFLFYGLYHGLTEPAEKALVKDLAPVSLRGRAYGAYNFIIGITAIPAGLLTGYLWQRFGALTALGTGSAVAALAAAALFAWQLETRAQHPG